MIEKEIKQLSEAICKLSISREVLPETKSFLEYAEEELAELKVLCKNIIYLNQVLNDNNSNAGKERGRETLGDAQQKLIALAKDIIVLCKERLQCAEEDQRVNGNPLLAMAGHCIFKYIQSTAPYRKIRADAREIITTVEKSILPLLCKNWLIHTIGVSSVWLTRDQFFNTSQMNNPSNIIQYYDKIRRRRCILEENHRAREQRYARMHQARYVC